MAKSIFTEFRIPIVSISGKVISYVRFQSNAIPTFLAEFLNWMVYYLEKRLIQINLFYYLLVL